MDAFVNGFSYSYSSGIVHCDGEHFGRIKNIAYADKRESQKGWAMNRASGPVARTSGVYDVDDVTMSMEHGEWTRLRAKLAAKGGGSYGNPSFEIVVQLVEPGNLPITDEIQGCRVAAVSRTLEQSGDELFIEITLSAMRVKTDGMALYDTTVT